MNRDGRRLYRVQTGTLLYLVAAVNAADAVAQALPQACQGQLRLDLGSTAREATEADVDLFALQAGLPPTRVRAAA